MICISVLFPAPFSPITAWMLSCCTSKATSCSAWTPGKRFEIPFILRIEGIGEGVANRSQEFRSSGVQEFRSQESGVRSQESGGRRRIPIAGSKYWSRIDGRLSRILHRMGTEESPSRRPQKPSHSATPELLTPELLFTRLLQKLVDIARIDNIHARVDHRGNALLIHEIIEHIYALNAHRVGTLADQYVTVSRFQQLQFFC